VNAAQPGNAITGELPASIQGQLIAAEVGPDDAVYLQSREPAHLYVVREGKLKTVVLAGVSRDDTGHSIFHTNTGAGLACASCHGEGGDDAKTWTFDGKLARRTPSLLGTVGGTAPYHWDADFADLAALANEVYTKRMSGRALLPDQLAALKGWLEALPAPRRPPVDRALAAAGQALFEGKAACAECHSGPSFTNNATMDVGTGDVLQVPPLIGVGARLPLLHDGCATDLKMRFTQCATPAHGQTSGLSATEQDSLVGYLNTL